MAHRFIYSFTHTNTEPLKFDKNLLIHWVMAYGLKMRMMMAKAIMIIAIMMMTMTIMDILSHA